MLTYSSVNLLLFVVAILVGSAFGSNVRGGRGHDDNDELALLLTPPSKQYHRRAKMGMMMGGTYTDNQWTNNNYYDREDEDEWNSDRAQPIGNPGSVREDHPCIPENEVVGREFITNPDEDEALRTETYRMGMCQCPGGCCRIYNWLVCDENDSLYFMSCICNQNTAVRGQGITVATTTGNADANANANANGGNGASVIVTTTTSEQRTEDQTNGATVNTQQGTQNNNPSGGSFFIIDSPSSEQRTEDQGLNNGATINTQQGSGTQTTIQNNNNPSGGGSFFIIDAPVVSQPVIPISPPVTNPVVTTINDNTNTNDNNGISIVSQATNPIVNGGDTNNNGNNNNNDFEPQDNMLNIGELEGFIFRENFDADDCLGPNPFAYIIEMGGLVPCTTQLSCVASTPEDRDGNLDSERWCCLGNFCTCGRASNVTSDCIPTL